MAATKTPAGTRARPTAKQAATSTKRAPTKAPARKTATAAATRKTAPAKKTTARAKKTAARKAVAKAPAKAAIKKPTKASAPRTATTTAAPAKAAAARKALTRKPAVAAPEPTGAIIPEPKGTTKDGIAYTKDFDVKFLRTQYELLVAERASLSGQATRLEAEADSLIEDSEMGDVQFDDEGGEGDTMVVERERDLALSAQARQTIADIDASLQRLRVGTYGYSVVSGRLIPRERLEAIPWANVLVEEKVGGIGRR
ncbi:MAG: hypothetical protein H0U21_03535 [Acidimicrobiia bacterium]|nr:hypothetical protein [Acidimicrobiia bacterium]